MTSRLRIYADKLHQGVPYVCRRKSDGERCIVIFSENEAFLFSESFGLSICLDRHDFTSEEQHRLDRERAMYIVERPLAAEEGFEYTVEDFD
jgi:hypothetical protein